MKALFFLLLLKVVFGSGHGESSSGSGESGKSHVSNYFRSTFQSEFYIPFAVSQCSVTVISGDSYIKPTCVSSTKIKVETYSDSSCSTLTLSKTYNSSSGQDFECGGDDTYMGVTIGAAECAVTFYAAVDACAKYSLTASTYSTYSCSSDYEGTVGIYTTSTCSGTAYSSYNLTDVCSVFTGAIYWDIANCSAATSIATTTSIVTTTKSSGESSGSSGESTSSESTSSESTSSESTSSESTGSESTGSMTTTAGSSSSAGNMIELNKVAIAMFVYAFICVCLF